MRPDVSALSPPATRSTEVTVDKLRLADSILRVAVGCWFTVTLVGQWLFMYYVVALYGASTVSGHFEDWMNKPLFRGYIRGDTVGNFSFAAHVLFAAVVTFGGIVQLVPQIRARASAVHRWVGRAFLLATTAVGASGLYMVWVRHASFDVIHSCAVSLNAVLTLVFTTLAWRTARGRDIASHRRWALRTFVVANGPGLFVRVAYAGWAVLADGAGTNGEMSGPMNYVFAFAVYLLPLAILELYLRGRDSARPAIRFAIALVVVAVTAYVAIGTYQATISRIAVV
ncbi:MAG TPA: DUF2306 domain-containing protein [Kofleriaceae bacterium]|nr:DUF2306 domain-containing protein [Kofleriaceae bacterium]